MKKTQDLDDFAVNFMEQKTKDPQNPNLKDQ